MVGDGGNDTRVMLHKHAAPPPLVPYRCRVLQSFAVVLHTARACTAMCGGTLVPSPRFNERPSRANHRVQRLGHKPSVVHRGSLESGRVADLQCIGCAQLYDLPAGKQPHRGERDARSRRAQRSFFDRSNGASLPSLKLAFTVEVESRHSAYRTTHPLGPTVCHQPYPLFPQPRPPSHAKRSMSREPCDEVRLVTHIRQVVLFAQLFELRDVHGAHFFLFRVRVGDRVRVRVTVRVRVRVRFREGEAALSSW
jgi:hypothetical protein